MPFSNNLISIWLTPDHLRCHVACLVKHHFASFSGSSFSCLLNCWQLLLFDTCPTFLLQCFIQIYGLHERKILFLFLFLFLFFVFCFFVFCFLFFVFCFFFFSKTIKKWELCVEKDGHVASVLLFVLGLRCFSRFGSVLFQLVLFCSLVNIWWCTVLFSPFLVSCYMSICWASVGSWNGSIQTKQVAR